MISVAAMLIQCLNTERVINLRSRVMLCILVASIFFAFVPNSKAINNEKTKLFICEKKANSALRKLFLETHPNVEFVDVEIDWAIEDPIERFCGHEELDIIDITNDEGISKLIDHGLLESLTFPEIINDYETYFPQAKELLGNDGVIIGVPVRFEIRPWMINQKLWNAYQLPPQPITFSEYLDLIDQWNRDYAPTYPIDAMAGEPGWGGTRQTVLLNLIEQYIYEQQLPGSVLEFMNDDLQKLIEKIETLEEISYAHPFQGPLLQGRYDSGFTSVDILDIQNLKEDDLLPIIPPVILKDSSPKIGGELSLLCLLRQSNNKELALEYLSFVAMHKDQYQPGLSQMLLSYEHSTDGASSFSSDVIEMWSAFLPYVTFYTDALGGFTYAREFEGITILANDLANSWEKGQGGLEEFGIEGFLQSLDLKAKKHYSHKH